MKIRNGFVSNSSSSSFVISLDDVTGRQLDLIKDHVIFGRVEKYNAWSITVRDGVVSGYCSMDNFNMGMYLTDIGIDEDKVDWD